MGKTKNEKRKTLNISHYNCLGSANEDQLYEFERGIQKIKWDIVGLVEVRREGERLQKRKNGNYLYITMGKQKDIEG